MEDVLFGANNEVISVKTRDASPLAGVMKGMILSSINGNPVGRADDEQRRRRNMGDELVLLFVPGTPAGCDEFDLNSGEDEDNNFNQRNLDFDTPNQDDVSNYPNSTDVLLDAAEKAGPGRCIIIMCEGVNPGYAISVSAERASCTVMYINAVARLKTRQSLSQTAEIFSKSLQKGLWIYIEQATKSISLLHKLAECIAEAQTEGVIHTKARVFLMCEPHPHFPEDLLKGSVTLRSTLRRGGGEMQLDNNLLESRVGHSVVRDGALYPVDALPEHTGGQRRVKISHEVNIVPLEKNTFMELSQGANPAMERETATGEGITRFAKYVFGANEKFISLCKVKDGRYAVGTTGGYVLILDADGLPLIQFRPHRACVWDAAFVTPYDFATACEDWTSSIFNYSLERQELSATSVLSLHGDVFAVTYANPDDPQSAVLSGGLPSSVRVLHSDRQTSSMIPVGVSTQAMRSTQRGHALIGGGNGACFLVDPGSCTLLETTTRHQRKVPAVSCFGPMAVTGGFDKMIRVWDVRSSFRMVSERAVSEVITAVSISDKYVAACSGSDLLVWDLRRIVAPLAIKQRAWKDLTRGLIMDGDVIITASADGVARFWSLGAMGNL
ncbi:hypothetical protein TraAM80_03850 [Trypanosoma rangeli]|uniref:Dynein heavy chain region D6 P-loop domain-containing protein n=1 Tax=Trypanosoma rangeli TaxID=5698 RepID=A0A422NMN1_TRYRA|nr:uncharacterized protein TraAM80_03850 [Trypanosoma rangeli]RNF06654.1 hypothetical protein TraAM80_03850 [Trypanosoma rangeli]|eukprot:RNF06654.1 hypothetical protein TraAM80_03850 [Trypanosoma rangeli]